MSEDATGGEKASGEEEVTWGSCLGCAVMIPIALVIRFWLELLFSQ